MLALFAVKSPHEQNLPPLALEEGELQIQYLDSEGVLHGGWWIGIGESPQPFTVLVTIDSTEETIDTMANTVTDKWLYLGDLVEPDVLNG